MTPRSTLLLGLLVSGAALAQADAGFAPKVVNPGDEPAEVIRDFDEPDAGAPPLIPDAGQPEARPMVSAPTPATVEAPSRWKVSAAIHGSFRGNYGGATLFPFDADRTTAALAPLQTRLRVAPEIHLGNLGLIAEADTATGAIVGIPEDTVVSARQPVPHLRALELRKLYAEFKWASGVFRVGQQTSHWGLGLLANDGGHDPEAGEFGQQHYGNLTYRALIAARPFFGMGGAWRAVEVAAAADLIVRDNYGDFSQGDRALQAVLALRLAKDAEHFLGVYGVYRNQRNVNVTDGGKATDAFIVDFAGTWKLLERRHRDFTLGWEFVGIGGTTTQARSTSAELLYLSEWGGAIKSRYRMGRTTLYLDWGYASGDQNPSDDRLESFRFDRDYKVGLVLFDQVMAYQSGRGAVRAQDPSVSGFAPEGAELIGTGGSVTGAWYLFPRLKFAMAKWLDAYGGPLFAFSTAKLTDPYNTRLAGGVATNPLGARPGSYLGTELDLGLQGRVKPIPELTISLTGELGLFFAGDAYRQLDGSLMQPVAFGRVRLGVSI